jgi:hypothetical protein
VAAPFCGLLAPLGHIWGPRHELHVTGLWEHASALEAARERAVVWATVCHTVWDASQIKVACRHGEPAVELVM